MTPKLIYQNPIMKMYLHDGQIICNHWDGFFSTEGYFRQALMHQNELIEQMGIKKVIADTSRVGSETILPEDMEWVREVNFPVLQRLGLQYLVTVVSEDVIVSLTNEAWQELVLEGLTVVNVKTLDEAFTYLASR
jgi:hypothetical protein